MIENYKIIALCTNRIYEKECYQFIGEMNNCLANTDMRLFVLNVDIINEEGDFRSSGSSDIFELLNAPGIDAVIIDEKRMLCPSTTEMIIDHVKKLGIPIAIIGAAYEGCLNVSFWEDGFTSVVKHMINVHGMTKFHMIAGRKDNRFSDARIQMFKEVLLDSGLPFDESMISYGDFWSGPATDATMRLIESGNLPQAIICANDNMALAVMETLQSHGYRVPEDVAVTGYDGIDEINYIEPMLTTVSQNSKDLCLKVFELLPELMNGKTGTEYISSTPCFNRSCGCNNSSGMTSLQYIIDQNDNFYRCQDENIELAEVGAKINSCSSFEEIAQLVFDSNTLYATCCMLKKECIDSSADPRIMHEKGYGKEMYLLFDTDKMQYLKDIGEPFYPGMIPSDEIIPSMKYNLEDNRFLIFNSIFYLGVPLGYICFHFSKNIPPNYMKIPQTITTLSNAIGGLRNNIYQKNLLMRIDEMYRTDSLTKLLNRWGFIDAYNKLLETLDNRSLMVILCDLDGLKQINDNYGHEEGDNAIRTASRTFRSVCPPDAVCTRFGGDEMLAVFPAEDARQDIRKAFNEALEEYSRFSGKPYNVSGSLGIIITEPGEHPSFEELIKRTDSLMYEEKIRRRTHT